MLYFHPPLFLKDERCQQKRNLEIEPSECLPLIFGTLISDHVNGLSKSSLRCSYCIFTVRLYHTNFMAQVAIIGGEGKSRGP